MWHDIWKFIFQKLTSVTIRGYSTSKKKDINYPYKKKIIKRSKNLLQENLPLFKFYMYIVVSLQYMYNIEN
ncbi:hypothetical protein CMU81_18370 [Elizabethkingia anophelis]|uniref:Uncharacterized protein n=1 Tax=Elizabethkingia anophelis TaxID=1117645 RepID=A0A494J1Z7_9FLAO|nr:hypothetical protein AYC66_01950 [Elizabethkingia anophelis]MDV2473431.1 hypothetical protein [Elizabethkingia anophelis]MDV3537460.1 hypothetical protein [Elizabethkingia anophelis]MDV3557808.1 hypothetical protein [Elizabethkingia anophelis]MDV3615786.1 hypothetical protein [Elizabethkingia anophelis]